jgi:general secretion pathway protein A
MFLEFYKLREQPFGVTPDPRFLYFGSTHREALASLLYAAETKRGFSALVAEPGMGKTSLLFRMLDSLHNSARTAFLFQTEGDSRELLRSLLRDLGIQIKSQDPVAMHEALNEGLLQELHAGRQVVVVIDEAQNLDKKVLETIRLLSNFETPTQKLMHIVLAGQPGLATKLSETGMTQLRQRVSTIIRLEPFRGAEIAKYIEHRLRTAGREGPSIFSPDALEFIARVSQGIPRNINSLCFQALSIGFATQSKQIGANILREVALDLDFAPRRNDRAGAQRATAWTPASVKPHVFPENSRIGGRGYAYFAPRRPSRMKWIGALACFALVPISIIAFSDSKLGLSGTLPGQVSGKVVNAVLSSSDPNADFVPAWPEKLKTPQPPPAPEAADTAPTTPSSDDQAGSPSPSAGENSEMPKKTDRVRSTRNMRLPQSHATPKAFEKNRNFGVNRSEASRFQAGPYGAPTRVQVLRPETVFQFALELYGQSNWKIVEAICAANPEIHDPYSVLSMGQWIRIPTDLVTVTADYNSRATIGRSR